MLNFNVAWHLFKHPSQTIGFTRDIPTGTARKGFSIHIETVLGFSHFCFDNDGYIKSISKQNDKDNNLSWSW